MLMNKDRVGGGGGGGVSEERWYGMVGGRVRWKEKFLKRKEEKSERYVQGIARNGYGWDQILECG